MYHNFYFNPRSPHGERPCNIRPPACNFNFNPRSPHGERLAGIGSGETTFADFNPRSPHGERPCLQHPLNRLQYFNPRSPHGERRLVLSANFSTDRFQSTLPARGATRYHSGLHPQRAISIHAPRTGSDILPGCIFKHCFQFQSTLPARGATMLIVQRIASPDISIHAPRTGSDGAGCRASA